MSLSAELEELLMKNAELKNKLQSIERTEKTLVIKMKVLEEKLTIQVLEQRIKTKLAVVEELQSKIRELENRLKIPAKLTPEVTRKVQEPQNKGSIGVMVQVASANSQQS
jgi:predicted RNase H-like nuclease (RuvC/YqgF family)